MYAENALAYAAPSSPVGNGSGSTPSTSYSIGLPGISSIHAFAPRSAASNVSREKSSYRSAIARPARFSPIVRVNRSIASPRSETSSASRPFARRIMRSIWNSRSEQETKFAAKNRSWTSDA